MAAAHTFGLAWYWQAAEDSSDSPIKSWPGWEVQPKGHDLLAETKQANEGRGVPTDEE